MASPSEDESQVDMFENTQTQTYTGDKDFEYPGMIFFLWNGQINPFVMVYLVELDAKEVNEKWLTGTLSPASRCKHRNFSRFSEFAVSIFAKVQKSNVFMFSFFYLIDIINSTCT